ncbi:hypothetical protein M8J76_009602 [Diaphorina citri]|nr:hypothetical protein M8J76_002151 [Diaphorina citri]KAI5733252.1 hypothetical protein M8J76_009602 [Diaphorina citri]
MLVNNLKYLQVHCAVLLVICLTVSAEIEPIEDEGTLKPPKLLQNVYKSDVHHSSTESPRGDLGFIHAFVAALSVIVVSELGDKTFFIAAIMAMRHPRVTVFIGAIAALALMTVLSVAFGMAANIIPRIWTYYISTVLFIIFGLKMLREGYKMSPNEGQEELEEVQSDLRKRDDELKARKKPGGSPPPLRRYPDEKHMDENAVFCDNVMNGGGDVEINVTRSTASSPIREAEPTILVSPGANSNPDAITIVRINSTGNGLTNHSTSNGVEVLPKFEKEALTGDVESGKSYQAQTISLLSRVVIQAFTLTFLAEWGDRSQLTTIILAAREDVYGVTLGGVLGHSLCTGLAVIGGRFIAQRISVRTVTITGGIVFLVFACTALLFDPADS